MSKWVIAEMRPEAEGGRKNRFGCRDAIYRVISENQTSIW